MIEIAHAAQSVSPAPSMGAWDLFTHASFLVQLVLMVLIGCSMISWAILISKWRIFTQSFRQLDSFLDIFWSGKSMDFIYSESKKYTNAPVAKMFQAGYLELQKFMEKERQKTGSKDSKTAPPESAIYNLERSLARAYRSESLRLERSLGFLATTGSTSPFIGLFGTVWGIMSSFQSIGIQGSASLATVAPGIAEALIATAVGLMAAIPAVIGYNYFLQRSRMLRTQMENFSGDFLNIVRRNFLS